MLKLTLIRHKEDEFGTHGTLHVTDEVMCYTLEPPWKNNKTDVSCIPEGEYLVTPHISPTQNPQLDGKCFLVNDVPGREDILIHIGNWIKDTKGCILVGMDRTDEMVTHSKTAMEMLLDKIGDNYFELTVRSDYR